MDAADCVRKAKALANVERAFRSLNTVDLKICPMHCRTADCVRPHILLCRLADYVEWHMLQAWAPLMFTDTDQTAKAVHDPVASATRSSEAIEKINRRMLDDGSAVHIFATLMLEMATIVRSTCRAPMTDEDVPCFDLVTTPNARHRRALELIRLIQLQSRTGSSIHR